MMPNDFPPWEAVYQQTQRWIAAGVFEAMVHDLRAVLEPGLRPRAWPFGRRAGQPHPALQPGERALGRLRRGEAQEGL
jgi:transposase